jgi:hypothetical protein
MLCKEKKLQLSCVFEKKKKLNPFFYLVLGLVVEKDVNDITTSRVSILPWTCP